MVTKIRQPCDILPAKERLLDPADRTRNHSVLSPAELVVWVFCRLAFRFNHRIHMLITPPSKPDRTNGADPRELVGTREGVRSERSLSSPVKKPHVLDHAIAQHALSALCDRHSDTRMLRLFSNQLLTVLAFEATRNLPLRESEVEVAGETHRGKNLSKPVVFVSLTRPGLGLSHVVADLIPNLSMGNITLDHAGGSRRLEPRLHLTSAPALSGAHVILFDPAVASGISAGIALHLLRSSGAADLSLLSFVISSAGLKRIQTTTPDVAIWTAAIDDELDPKRSRLSSLGDLGKRLYTS